jgi:diguanylate cyclase (GGDEF)-like protein
MKPPDRGLLDSRVEASLAAPRDRLMSMLSMVGVAFLVPFALHDLARGRRLLGGAVLVVVAALVVDIVALYRHRTPPIPYWLLILPMAATITITLRTLGVIGAFWCYPAVLFLHFVLSRWLANLCSIGLLAYATVMVHHYLGMRVAVRFGSSLALSIVIINIFQSIIRELQSKLLELSSVDPLTGALNRRHMQDRLLDALQASRRGAGPATLLLVDIDHFKKINDERGHEAGDEVLKNLVALMKQRSRRIDLLFRMGGEEFVLLLPATAESPAVSLAEELRGSIAAAPLLEGRAVTVSIGVGELNTDDTVFSWIKRADDALYAAKNGGRNRVARGSELRETSAATTL